MCKNDKGTKQRRKLQFRFPMLFDLRRKRRRSDPEKLFM